MTVTGPTRELGHVGSLVPTWNGFFAGDQDEVPGLTWPDSNWVYHRMRTDSQVDALLRAVTYPLRRRRWVIDPNGASEQAVTQVATDMALPILGTGEDPPRGRRRFSHGDHLRHALLALVYGHMFFEQVGVIDENLDWRLRKLGPRMPQSVLEIKVARDGGLEGITQVWDGQVGAGPKPRRGSLMFQGIPLPVSSLVAYTWEREGGNWVGRSMLRPLYKHWLVKDRLMRIDAIKHERFGVGIPTATAPAGGNPADYAAMAQAIRATESGGVGLPQGATIGVEGIKGTLPDIIESMRYHDELMARSFLAMILQLGQTETGSRALGDTFSVLFDLSLDVIAEWYAGVTSEHVIEDIIDWNFGIDENAPLLAWEDDPTEETPSISELVTLVDAGVLKMTDEDEAWVRDRWHLPTRDLDAAVRPLKIAPPTEVAAGRRTRASSQTVDNPAVGHRQPMPHEVRAAVDFATLQNVWQSATETLVDAWQAIRTEQIVALTGQVEAAVAANSLSALASLTAPTLGQDVIESKLLEVAENAVTGARAEAAAQGVTVGLIDVVGDLGTSIRARAEAVATLMARGISESAARQALSRYGTDLPAAEVAAAVQTHLEELSDSYLNDQLGGAITQAQNAGRRAVFSAREPSSIYASELLDIATCSNCAQVDGRRYTSLAEAEKDYPTGGNSECLGGPRCRGTLVAVYSEAGDEEDE